MTKYELGEAVKKARKDMGISQLLFAARLCVNQNVISRIETGKDRCPLPTIRAINELAGTDIPVKAFKGKETDCYDCAYRRGIAGSTHSECGYDWKIAMIPPPKERDTGIEAGLHLFPYEFLPERLGGTCHAHNKQLNKKREADLKGYERLFFDIK